MVKTVLRILCIGKCHQYFGSKFYFSEELAKCMLFGSYFMSTFLFMWMLLVQLLSWWVLYIVAINGFFCHLHLNSWSNFIKIFLYFVFWIITNVPFSSFFALFWSKAWKQSQNVVDTWPPPNSSTNTTLADIITSTLQERLSTTFWSVDVEFVLIHPQENYWRQKLTLGEEGWTKVYIPVHPGSVQWG